MEHVAIDLGSRESQVCIRDDKGEIVLEKRMLTRSLPSLLRKRPPSCVVMETCAEAFNLADAASEMDHEVRVVPATLVRQLGVGARHIKTDLRDARALSEASVRLPLPSVHIPTTRSREGKAMCNTREVLVRARTMLINATRGYLRTQAIKVSSGASTTFGARVHKAVGDTDPETTVLPAFVLRLLSALTALDEQILAADRELQARVQPDPVCTRLMTIPGVGPVCATRFVTTLDTPFRFAGVDQVQSYLGLSPGEHQSGDKKRRTGTIKCGAASTRAALIQSAWCLYRVRKHDPMVLWAMEVERRRGKQIAITALARKLAAVMYVMWRDGTTYDPSRGSRENSKPQEARSTS
jgi:transposase